MKRVARWVGVVGVAALALGAGSAAAQTTYRWQISNGATVAGATTNWTAACGTALSGATVTTMTTAAFACANTTITDSTATVNHVFLTLVASPAYAVATGVTGGTFLARLSNSIVTSRNADFQVGYVSGGVFTGFGAPVVQAYTNALTTYTVNLATQAGTVPAGASLALQIRKATATADVLTLTLGSTPGNSGTLTAAEVARTLTLANSSAGEAASALAPGAAKVALDAFTLATSAGTVTPSSVTVTMPAGSAALIGSLTLESASSCAGTIYSTITNPASDAPSFTTFAGLSIGTVASNLWVCVTPRTHAAMPVPPGTQVAVTGQITAFAATGYSVAGADTVSPARTIDNFSPNPPGGLGGAAGFSQAVMTWTTEPPDADFLTGGKVVVLGKIGSAPTDVPVEGTDYVTSGPAVTIGTSFVACFAAPGAKSCTATGLTPGQSYYFAAFSRDANLNHSIASLPAGPITPLLFTAEGSPTGGTLLPVISILNPMNGAVLTVDAVAGAKVQIRIYSRDGSAPGGVQLLINGAATATAPVKNTKYGSAIDSGAWEYTITTADALAAGSTVTLRARASNLAGGPVYSGTITVKMASASTRGDGKLLVRDNSSQLCSDCHALATHGAEATGNKYGSWTAACRDCHTAHSTHNLELVSESIKPPEVTGATAAKAVVFRNRSTGYGTNAYANPANNGPCQVCHTRTGFYGSNGVDLSTGDASGNATTGHNISAPCMSCHLHSKGMGASCTTCHGTEGRTGAVGADTHVASAPPVVAPGATVKVTGGGEHEKHVTLANYRSTPLQCADCHAGASHQTPSQTDIAYSAFATGNGTLTNVTVPPLSPPSGALTGGWTGTPNCTNWCHGDGLPGGGRGGTWTWNVAQTLACNSCHGQAAVPMPPAATAHHPQNSACVTCHGAGYLTTGLTGGAKNTHINGSSVGGTDKPANGCTACHGDLAGLAGAAVTNEFDPKISPGYTAIIGYDTHGNNVSTAVGVGAHQRHQTSSIVGALTRACSNCHGTQPASLDMSHANGTINNSWSALATGGGTVTMVPTAFDSTFESSPSCTNYCHSTGKPIGVAISTTSKTWTGASFPASGCGTCHLAKATLATNSHEWHLQAGYAYAECQTCHVNTASASTGIVSGGGGHVNGTNDVNFDAVGDAARVTGAAWSGAALYQCSSLYCHSNATPLQGANSNKTPAWNETTWVRAGASANECVKCHAMAADAVVNASSTNLSHAHYTHATIYVYNCSVCHSGIAAGTATYPTTAASIGSTALHVNGVKDVAWDAFNSGSALAYGSAGANTCSNTYCHSDGQSSASPNANAVVWNATVTCASCHGGYSGTIIATGKHTAHVNNAADLGTGSYFCGDCHATTVTAGATPTVNVAGGLHVNKTKDGSIPNRGTMASTWGGATCGAVYCHSSGQRGAANVKVAPAPTWADAAWAGNICINCHGRGGATFGAPDYATTATTFNSHAAHVGSSADCANCHNTTTTTGLAVLGSTHTDGVITMGWNATKAGAPTFVAGTATTGATCTNVKCHNNNATAAVWGGPKLLCGDCHLRTAALGGDSNNWVINDGVAASINSDEWTAVGHGSTSVTGNSFAEFAAVTGPNRCVYCHDSQNASANHGLAGNPFRLRGAANSAGATGAYNNAAASINAVCFNCHASSATVAYGVDPDGASALPKVGPATARVDSYHYGTYSGANHDATHDGGARCWDCHDVHGDGANLAMIGTDTLRDSSDLDGLAGTRSTTGAILTSRAAGGYAKTTTPFTGICQVCHTLTTYWLADGTGQVHQTNDCMTCHDHNQTLPTDAFKGSGECIQCHATTKGTTIVRRAIVTEFSQTWSHKRSGGRTVTNADCAVCHMEANSPADPTMSGVHGDGYVNLRDPDTGSGIQGVYWTGTDAGGYTSTTTYLTFTQFSRNLASKTLEEAVQAIQINQCLKCHDANGAASTLARVPGAPSGGRPFNTTIAGATYTGSGVTAFGTIGNVTDINSSFAVTNSSYHPVRGKQNNWYAKLSRLAAPWNSTTRVTASASTNSWGDLISCWDCHAPNGTASTQVLTLTVTAHGGATTLRGNATASGTAPTTTTGATLCKICHDRYDQNTGQNHGAGSAFTASGQSPMSTYLRYGCNKCHASNYTTAVARPVRAQDVHGINALPTGGTKTLRWSTTSGTPAQLDTRPYAFIRNTTALSNYSPARIGGSTYSPNCTHLSDTDCGNRSESPGTGGTF